MADLTQEPGGFLSQNLPSPAPSNFSTSSAPSSLPHPRSHPLKAGSAKEATARRYIETRLLHISRRYTKKFQPPQDGEDVHGYDNMTDVCKDLGEVVDVLWLSGTRGLASLQIPSLLNIAGATITYIPAFLPAPAATFGLLRKLDHAFVSLLKGEDSVTGESLPGFGNDSRGLSRTDMVRLKSLVESTRVLVVEIMIKASDIGDDELEEIEMDVDDMDLDGESTLTEGEHGMEVARVYAGTVVELGMLLPSEAGFDVGFGQS